MAEQTGTDMKEWAISWEEALEGEMEYRKRMKNKSPMPQHPVDSVVLPSGSQSQEQMQEGNATGLLKRKDTSETFPHQAKKVLECPVVPTQPIKGQLNPSQKMYVQKAPSQRRQDGLLGSPPFLNKKRPPQQSSSHQLPLKRSNYHQSLPCHPQVQNARTLLGGLLTQRAPVKLEPVHWCSLCNVKCMTTLHLELHRQGKKHKANLEGVWGARNNNRDEEIWCLECNVKCVNEFSWNQHRMGQKHLAHLGKKAIEASGSAGPVIKARKIWCAQGSERAPCTEEQEIAKVNMEMPDKKLMSSAAKSPKLKTTKWPNYI